LSIIRLPNNWIPREYQLPAWRYMQNGGKHCEIVWHRRSGKDELGLHWTAVAAFKRVAQYWYMLPEYSQARKAIWDAINPHTGKKRIDEAFPIELRQTTRNDEMKIIFKNGSSFQAVGSDDPSKLVGSPPAGIVYSEWALSNPATRAYLRPILMENGGWQIFNTTPRGRNHAHTTLEAAKKNPEAFAQVLDATQTGVFTRAQLELELQNYIADFGEDYGRSKFEQEYLCSFDAANLGAILARQITISERKGLISDEVVFDPNGQPIQISADLGRRDTATWWFWQPVVGGYNIIDYDSGFGIDAEEWCERLNKRLSKYKLAGNRDALGVIWLPHDARTKTFSAKESAIEIFLRAFGQKKVDITPMTSIADRINAARVVLPRVKFNETNCKIGLDGLRAWSYAYNDVTKTFGSSPLHDWASHDGDGFSYGCQIMQMASPPPPPIEEMKGVFVGKTKVSLNELWKDTKVKTDNRI
jgi:phage terminase large subunit